MMRLDPPRKFSFRPEERPEGSTEFKRFRTAGKLHLEDGEIQRDTLIYCMGQEAEKIYRTLQFNGEGETDTNFDCLMGKFTKYFIPKRNIIYERSQFQERKQREIETIEEIYRVLKDLVRHCNYGAEEDSIIRDRKNKPKYNQKPTSWRSSNQNTRGKQIHEVTDEARETVFIDTVEKNTSEPFRIVLSITHLADDKKTGADVNIINKQTWLSLGKPQLLEGNINLSSPGGALEVKGKFEAEIKGVKTYINVDNLLSRDTASALKLIKRVDQVKFNMVKCTPVKIKAKESANFVTEQSQERARENERTRHHRRNYRTN
ncbi:Pol polyprotein [Plakobranchus ocellatus]|uniref:Pol polyprotein n=1 Tax=Plakobranchus ocellatus TaxID=259542 RepID=A0AAV4C412_9GAST|nr:Pol polyprotein [Plakobranchus ocellatus]